MLPQTSTILIVDDHLSTREVLRGLLAEQGYALAFATNGAEALSQAAKLSPDLILLDVMMPDMDGFEVCQRLRADAQLAEVPVVMLTALDDPESRVRGIEVGADDFLNKPVNSIELLARVRTTTRLNRYRNLLMERTYRQQAEDEVYRRNRELTLLNQVIVAAAATLDIEDILYIACQALAQVFGLPRAAAVLLNAEKTAFITKVDYVSAGLQLEGALAEQQQNPDYESLLNDDIPLAGLLSDYLSEQPAALLITDEVVIEPRLTPLLKVMHERDLSALIIEPIPIGDRVAGLIELGSVAPRDFSSQDLTLAQTMAAAVGRSLETAQLHQKLQQHAQSLEETVAQRTRQLQTERDRTRAILEALGEAVMVADVAGTIRYLNPAAEALTGFSKAEAIGQDWPLWSSRQNGIPEAKVPSYDEIMTTVRSGQTWTGEIKDERQDGTLYEALLTVASLPDPHSPDQTIGYVSVQSDITALKEAERIRSHHQEREKQAALDRLRHTFLSTVNHELRSPLALIFQGMELLEDTDLTRLADEQLDALTAIQRQTGLLGQMVEALTRVAAFLSKQETVRPVPARLEPIFNNLLPLAQFQARSKEIMVETDIEPDLPTVRLDVKQLEEALNQLLDNAIKFNQTGGKIKISAYADEAWVSITIADTGIGIEAEQMNRIWELFEQGADPLRRAQEGLGLGLALARYIVEVHRGTIESESTLGQGSTFTVKLPRYKQKV